MTDAGKIYTMIGIFRRPIAFEARGQGLYITGLQKSQDEEKITGKNAQDKHLELWAKVGGCLALLNSPNNVDKWKGAVGGRLGVSVLSQGGLWEKH